MRGRGALRLIAALVVIGVGLGGFAAVANAGEWVQVSCETASGAAASNQGWTTYASSPGPAGSISTYCSPDQPMNGYLSDASDPSNYVNEGLKYTPPSGSTLAGGTLNVSGNDRGANANGLVATVIYSPADVFQADAVFECIETYTNNPCSSTNLSYSDTTVTLPTDQGGFVDVQLGCTGPNGADCTPNGSSSADFGDVDVNSADLLLSNSSTPAGSGFSGTILDPDATGTAHLLFTAADPGGPGVYNVTASIDDTVVYSATPDTENGACVSAGTLAGSGAMEFTTSQPCPQSVPVSVPINLTSLSAGTHELTVTVTDAAGNTATVLDQYVSTRNVTSPLPKATHGSVRVRLIASTRYIGADTRLLKISHTALPRDARLTVTDRGPKRPRLGESHAVGAAGATRLLTQLTRLTFHSGDTLTLTIAAAHERSERIQFSFRDAKVPTDRLL